jgi:hypothetical protein
MSITAWIALLERVDHHSLAFRQARRIRRGVALHAQHLPQIIGKVSGERSGRPETQRRREKERRPRQLVVNVVRPRGIAHRRIRVVEDEPGRIDQQRRIDGDAAGKSPNL